MTSRRTVKFGAGGVAALVISAMVLAGCGSSSSSSSSSTAAGSDQIATAKGSVGTYLTGAGGRALYMWVADTSGKSVCSGACAQLWPPLETKGKPTAGPGVNASDLGTTKRSDGSEQVTYKGHPLYYFAADKAAGSLKGQGNNGFGAKWWLVAPSGDAITTSGSSGGGSSGGGYASPSSSY